MVRSEKRDVSAKARIGAKVRALRRREGVSQAALAKRLEISGSYLNLIEHDRRPMSAALLIKLAQLFDIDLRSFAADSDARMIAELREAFGDPLFDDLDLVTTEIREMVSAAPVASQAVVQLYRSYLAVRESAEGLAAKLSADLALPGVARARLPTEEVTALIHSNNNHFPRIERAAEKLRSQAGLDQRDLSFGMSRFLQRELGVRTEIVKAADDGGALRRYDQQSCVLRLSESLPLSSHAFQLAHQIGLLAESALLDELASDHALTTDESRGLCRVVLANYFAASVLMPYEPFRLAAHEERHDIELLQNRFGVNFEMICHRLTTLQRPGAEGIPFHFVRVDIAGNISKWFSASGLTIPSFGGACPRWNVHAAFLTPGRITVQLARTADSELYFSIARTISHAARGYHIPASVQAVTIGCAVEHAHRLVYADGVDLNNTEAAVPIGTTCRMCQHQDCMQRVMPPIQQPLQIDDSVRGHSFYGRVRPADDKIDSNR